MRATAAGIWRRVRTRAASLYHMLYDELGLFILRVATWIEARATGLRERIAARVLACEERVGPDEGSAADASAFAQGFLEGQRAGYREGLQDAYRALAGGRRAR